MSAYLVLNAGILALAYLLVFFFDSSFLNRRWLLATAALLSLTAVFDSLIIAAGIVDYNLSKILGVYIGWAPIEDFAYTLAAMLVMPLLWNYFRRKRS